MEDLDLVAKRIVDATAPEDIFGLIPTSEDPLRIIGYVFRQLAKSVHPDLHDDGKKKLAKAAFDKLTELKTTAEERVKAGIYGKRTAALPPKPKGLDPVIIQVRSRKYIVKEKLYTGDVADLFRAALIEGSNEQEVVFKYSQDVTNNDLLENEAKNLGRLYPATQKDEKFYRYLPRLIDSFQLKTKSGEMRRVNVFPNFEDHVSLAEILAAYPSGLDYRDMVWMFKRLLDGIGFAHTKGFIHGAVLPPHVLVHGVGHGAKVVGWSYSVKVTEPTPKTPPKKPKAKSVWDVLDEDAEDDGPKYVKAICTDYKDFYPPEILKKQAPTPATDIYMAAKCALALLGGNLTSNAIPARVPRQIQGLLSVCLLEAPSKRPNDAWTIHEELDEMLLQLVGPPKYRLFSMPRGWSR